MPTFKSKVTGEPFPAGENAAVRLRRLSYEEVGSGDEMTVDELKRHLKAQGLPVSGSKDELIERLDNAPATDGPNPQSDES